MYKFESFIRGARGDVCDGDAGVDFGGAGVSMRGIGVGEGKLWDIVMALRNCAGAAISEIGENKYLSVYRQPLRRGLNPLSEEECAILVSCLRRQMFVFSSSRRSHHIRPSRNYNLKLTDRQGPKLPCPSPSTTTSFPTQSPE